MNAAHRPVSPRWDAAYVLGALSPAERREFEEHLAGCPACQAAVSELAGMPGLLAQVPPEDAALLAAAPPEVDRRRPAAGPAGRRSDPSARAGGAGWSGSWSAAAAALVVLLGRDRRTRWACCRWVRASRSGWRSYAVAPDRR